MDPLELRKAGLTKNQSKVYMALLRTGTAKSGDILKEAGLNSGKIYDILESLKEKNLASETEIDGVRHFTASPPSKLIDHIEEKKKELEEKEEDIRSLIPELENQRELELEDFRTSVYTGVEGQKTANEEAMEYFDDSKPLLVMGATEEKNEKINEYWRVWTTQESKKGTNMKIIASERGEFYDSLKNIENVDCRVFEMFKPSTIVIYPPDAIVIYNFLREPINAVLMREKNLELTFEDLFEKIWEAAEE